MPWRATDPQTDSLSATATPDITVTYDLNPGETAHCQVFHTGGVRIRYQVITAASSDGSNLDNIAINQGRLPTGLDIPFIVRGLRWFAIQIFNDVDNTVVTADTIVSRDGVDLTVAL